MTHTDQSIPDIICGPMIRRLTPDRIVFWWISPTAIYPHLKCYHENCGSPFVSLQLSDHHLRIFKVGAHAFVHLADIRPDKPFPKDQKIEYNFILPSGKSMVDLMPHLVYDGEKMPSFMIKEKIKRFFHGSCRKPHHNGEDAMTGLDKEIGQTLTNPGLRPAFLMLTGDQIYADDVAGPMLYAIHQTIKHLKLYDETFSGSHLADSNTLYQSNDCYYGRKQILPRTRVGKHWYRRGGIKHIFSSSFAHNHMVTFAEWMAMYILVWSPALWTEITIKDPGIPQSYQKKWAAELEQIQQFVIDLPAVQRLFAHIPTYMIFDDHDITDDWNLTARWEKRAYGHPFTKRIIGNGLMAYFFCQGLGNSPDSFSNDLLQTAQTYCKIPGESTHRQFINALFLFKHWHYEVPVFPELVVVDSRTRRWKQNRNPASPSGLLDWEALMKLQHKLMKTDAILLVAPAPIFGVKLIELIQRVFTTFGYSLTVDAENWMSHRKSAYILLEIFKNAKTASYNTIISGDVHYSFAYDIELRFTDHCPGIWQITSSGIKNQFPEKLLSLLDRVNQFLYAPASPLNWFTKRRDLIIQERQASQKKNRRLVSRCGVGRITLDSDGAPVEIAEVYPDGTTLTFNTPHSDLS